MSDDLLDHIPALRAYARSLCSDKSNADDLVQETLELATAQAESFSPGMNLRAWLFAIMRNRFHATRSHWGSMSTSERVSPRQPAPQERHLRGHDLERALAALPVRDREAIVLVVVLGESHADTARLLGCDIDTIKCRVNRARNRLRSALGATI